MGSERTSGKLRCSGGKRRAAKSRRRFLQRYKKGEIFFFHFIVVVVVVFAVFLFWYSRVRFPYLLHPPFRLLALSLSVFHLFFCHEMYIYICSIRVEWAKSNNSLVRAVGNLCSPIYINLCQILEHIPKRHPSLHLLLLPLLLYCSISCLPFQKFLRNTHWIIKILWCDMR